MADLRSDPLRAPTEHERSSDGNTQRRTRVESLSDDRLQRKVCERLTAAPGIDSSEITVNVRNRDVTLEGEVPRLPMKRAAEACALEVLGVERVHNLLQIPARPASEPRRAED